MAEEFGSTLAQAVIEFLAGLPAEQRQWRQQELNKFVRWYGGGRFIGELGPQEVGAYAESMGTTSPEPLKRLEPVKEFLAYARKKGLTRTNLGLHLRVSKSPARKKTRLRLAGRKAENIELTAEGMAGLQRELEALKEERPRVVQEIHQAAADKDVRENAPLEAARERHGQIEGRIRELEATLRSASVLRQGTAKVVTAGLGCTVTLRDLSSERELRYRLVNPSEADPAAGKLSIKSPVGRALVDHGPGQVVEVRAPAGTLRYCIERIER